MPAYNPVMADATLTPGLRADFLTAYDAAYQGMQEELSLCMDLAKGSDKRREIYAYYNAAPHPRFWPSGEAIPEDVFDSVAFGVTNLKWGLRTPWKREDREDDQIGGLFGRVADIGTHFGMLDERVFFQIMLGTTDAELLPFIPNAPDGAAIFSATAGDGTARFAVTGGNVVTGQSISTVAATKTAIYVAINRMAAFQDGRGQPLWGRQLEKGTFVIYCSLANGEVVQTAVNSGLMAQAVLNAAGTENVGGAAIQNILKLQPFQFKVISTQRITDNHLRIFASGAPHKPVFVQNRTGLEETFATQENSDSVRTSDLEYAQWRCRKGYGVFLPYQCVDVSIS